MGAMSTSPEVRPARTLGLLSVAHAVNHAQAVLLPLIYLKVIDEFGVGVLIREVIERVRAQDGVLHVSFDVDFLDPGVAPGVGTTVRLTLPLISPEARRAAG